MSPSQSSVKLRITHRSLIPFLKGEMEVSASDVSLGAPFYTKTPPAVQPEFNKGFIGTLERMASKLKRFTSGVMRTMRMDGYVPIFINGKTFAYQLDKQGFAWEK